MTPADRSPDRAARAGGPAKRREAGQTGDLRPASGGGGEQRTPAGEAFGRWHDAPTAGRSYRPVMILSTSCFTEGMKPFE